jgi:hypothetical protein
MAHQDKSALPFFDHLLKLDVPAKFLKWNCSIGCMVAEASSLYGSIGFQPVFTVVPPRAVQAGCLCYLADAPFEVKVLPDPIGQERARGQDSDFEQPARHLSRT